MQDDPHIHLYGLSCCVLCVILTVVDIHVWILQALPHLSHFKTIYIPVNLERHWCLLVRTFQWKMHYTENNYKVIYYLLQKASNRMNNFNMSLIYFQYKIQILALIILWCVMPSSHPVINLLVNWQRPFVKLIFVTINTVLLTGCSVFCLLVFNDIFGHTCDITLKRNNPRIGGNPLLFSKYFKVLGP